MNDTIEKLTGGDVHANLSPAPYEKAVDTATKGAVDAASAFLSNVCLPGLAELGGMLQDRVSYWRRCQALKLIQKWEAKMDELETKGYHAPPRLIETGLERGSIVDSDHLRDMWAGLLTSSCTPEGTDDSNLIFMNILDQLTIPQAKIVQYACEKAVKYLSHNGLVQLQTLEVSLETLIQVTGVDDVERLDRELDSLTSLGLLALFDAGFNSLETMRGESASKPAKASVTPSPLGVHFYVRCQGSSKTAVEYFDLKLVNKENAVAK